PRLSMSSRAGILIDIRRRAGKTDGEYVVPAVTVEVIDPSEKVVRVPLPRLSFCGIDFAFLRERRPREPIRPVDNVCYAIAIQIARCNAFGVIDVGKLLPLEGVDCEVLAPA